jgi:hypothetical protein
MRRAISIALAVFGLAMLITGIEKLFPPFDEMTFVPHIVNSFIFGVLAVVHIWLNWKALMHYFRRLGWWWGLVGLGFALVIGSSIVMPVLMAGDAVS